ncbi:MAG TPA: hypothetical protein VFH80_06760 [Solirubrobacteraceae bacterium]|nr:hypothetical protein [Solirubrobacteraceae bacterium]
MASTEPGEERFAATAATLRRQLAALAFEVARVEDDLAATLDRLAKRDPDRADELHERAEAARRYAEFERETARRYDD